MYCTRGYDCGGSPTPLPSVVFYFKREPLSDSGSDEVSWCLGISSRELPERGVSDQRLGTLIGAEPAGSRAAYLSYGFYG